MLSLQALQEKFFTSHICPLTSRSAHKLLLQASHRQKGFLSGGLVTSQVWPLMQQNQPSKVLDSKKPVCCDVLQLHKKIFLFCLYQPIFSVYTHTETDFLDGCYILEGCYFFRQGHHLVIFKALDLKFNSKNFIFKINVFTSWNAMSVWGTSDKLPQTTVPRDTQRIHW